MIKILLKFTFAAALIYWLLISGKLDLSLVKKSIQYGPQWIIALLLIFSQNGLSSFRYKLLLETKSKNKLPFFGIYKINYIGQFFSAILPGAVTGDLIKLIYVKKLDKNFSKTFLITTALLDRIIGLTGLLFLAGFFSLIYFSEISSLSSQITNVIFINLILFAGAILFLGTLVAPYYLQIRIVNIAIRIPFLGMKISDILDQVFSLREKRKKLFFSFLISIFIHVISIFSFWIITSPFYSSHLPLSYAFTVIPVGLIATAIPLSPGGLGVGHVLFANLFSFVNIKNGASLFNLFFLCNLVNNLLGIIPYVSTGKVKDLEEIKNDF